jgi:ankyrin repeat protein
VKVPDRQSFTTALNEVRDITSKLTIRTENDLERTVFPRAFERNIRRLSQRKGAGDILAFVLDSSRQFREAELCYVLACYKNPRTLQADTHFGNVDLSEVTQGLLTVGDDGLISFVHPGLRTYLQRNRALPGFHLDLSDKNSTLAQICISYLSSGQFSDGPCASREDLTARISRSPFLDYAAKHWHRHYIEADKNGTDMTLRKSAKQFLSQPGSVSSAWQIMFLVRPLTKEHGQSQTEDSSSAATDELYAFQARFHATGLHLAVQLRLDDLAHVLATDSDPSIINRTDGSGQTPLHLAVALGADVIAENLLNHGGDANAKNLEGFSPWHIAAANGNLSMVRMFLKQPAERLHVNSQVAPNENQQQDRDGSSARGDQTMHGATSLHLAALKGHAEIVQSIIRDGRCNRLIEDRSGMTEFHQACKHGQIDVVKLLIATSAKYVRQPSKKNGRIGLHLACKYASGYEVAKFLLEAYTDLCRIADSNGEVALHHAARGGVVRIVQLLLQQPDININARNKRDQTPLAIAAERENAALCTLYDHDGAHQWMHVNGIPVADIVRRQREKPTDI